MTTQEKIAVMQAHVDGKVIQFKSPKGDWRDCPAPHWDWFQYVYRIKPEPRVVWIHKDQSGAGLEQKSGELHHRAYTGSTDNPDDWVKFVEVLS